MVLSGVRGFLRWNKSEKTSPRLAHRQKMKIKFVPKDMWIGLYVDTKCLGQQGCCNYFERTWYLCLLPCIPIIWTTRFTVH